MAIRFSTYSPDAYALQRLISLDQELGADSPLTAEERAELYAFSSDAEFESSRDELDTVTIINKLALAEKELIKKPEWTDSGMFEAQALRLISDLPAKDR